MQNIIKYTLMKKEFDLGMSIVPIWGRKRHLRILVEFDGQPYRKKAEGYFAVSGIIGGKIRPLCWGQCQDSIHKVCHPKYYEFMDELLRFDKAYHLKICRRIPAKDAERIKEIINS